MDNAAHILVANADPAESARLSAMIRTAGHRCRVCDSLEAMATTLQAYPHMAVVLDIDTIAVDNRAIRALATAYPHVSFLCTSSKRFHPELREALSYNIYACLNKPVDADELKYWIRCIRESESGSRDPPPGS